MYYYILELYFLKSNFTMKNFKHTEELKEYYSEYSKIQQLDL